MLVARNKPIQGAKVLILGFTFKENCPDTRNTKVIDIYKELQSFSIEADIYDPWASPAEVKLEYGIDLIAADDFMPYDAVILAVAHAAYRKIDFQSWKDSGTIIFDTKAFIDRAAVDARL